MSTVYSKAKIEVEPLESGVGSMYGLDAGHGVDPEGYKVVTLRAHGVYGAVGLAEFEMSIDDALALAVELIQCAKASRRGNTPQR